MEGNFAMRGLELTGSELREIGIGLAKVAEGLKGGKHGALYRIRRAADDAVADMCRELELSLGMDGTQTCAALFLAAASLAVTASASFEELGMNAELEDILDAG